MPLYTPSLASEPSAAAAENLRLMIEDMAHHYQRRATEKNIEIITRYSEAVAEDVIIDRDQFDTVMSCLVETAINAVSSGFVLISVSAKAKLGNMTRFKINVAHTGGPAAHRPCEETLKRSFKQQNLNETRTHISVLSKEPNYTIVSWSLELQTLTRIENNTAKIEVMRGKKILLIEPSAIARKIIAEQLTEWGLICETAFSFQAAFQKTLNVTSIVTPYDAVLYMERDIASDNAKLISIIQEASAFQNAAFIMMCKSSESQLSSSGGTLSAAATVHKPIRRYELLSALYTKLGRAAKVAPNSVSEPDVKPLKILVAEDNLTNQKVLNALLLKENVHLTFAGNGVEAVEMFKVSSYDIILMDLSMPVMGGLEAAQKIREYERIKGRNATPIIGVSAHAAVQDRREATEAGMDDYLCKPICTKSLFDILKQWSDPQVFVPSTARAA